MACDFEFLELFEIGVRYGLPLRNRQRLEVLQFREAFLPFFHGRRGFVLRIQKPSVKPVLQGVFHVQAVQQRLLDGVDEFLLDGVFNAVFVFRRLQAWTDGIACENGGCNDNEKIF